MKKLYLKLAALVPGIMAALISAGYSQSMPDSTAQPGMTANPGLSSQQSDRNHQPASRSRNTGTMENGTAGNSGTRNGTPSSTMAKDADSIAPGSAPKGSTPSQMAKSSTADNDASSDTSTTAGSAAPNDAATSSGAGASVAPGSAPKGSSEPQMAKPDAREASKMDSDAPASALPPPGSTEGADANKP